MPWSCTAVLCVRRCRCVINEAFSFQHCRRAERRHATPRRTITVAAPAQRSKRARSFRGQKILQPGHPDALFYSKNLTTFFSCRPQNTGRQRRFTVKIKQNKAVI